MSDEVYERLADALNRLPNGFPRTPSGVEIRILRKMLGPEDAALAGQLGGDLEPVEVIARRAGLPPDEVVPRLMDMAHRGLLWFDQHDAKSWFRLAPFIIGSFGAQVDRMDHELAHLVEEYLSSGGAAGIMGPQPALHRVVPAHGAVKSEWIMPYDDVRAILLAAKTFHVGDCTCRVQQGHLGHRCAFPVHMCLSFSSEERPARPDDVSREEALAILDRSEEIGMVHTVSNIMQGLFYVCNCCGCCCAILRGINEWGVENSVAYANYTAVIDADECLGCGTCVERCQVHAISKQGGVAVVDARRCIGCGLCVTGCPNDIARLQLKPEAEIVHPPVDFAAWEHERLRNRHLIE